MDNDIMNLTIIQALEDRKLRDGLSQACRRQITRLNPLINAFITVSDEHASDAEGVKRRSLSGIPIAVKDLYDTAGIRTTGGSPFFKDNVPDEDAAAVARLKADGAEIIGKTNTHEIALGVTNINPHYGTCRNPWDTSRITGGSSGGSAAAVAAGMCMAALGTDTGGSIRIPASLCGVVGLKPTYGRVSLRGVLPLSWNLDHAGPLTRGVPDAAMLLGILAGYDRGDPASSAQPVDDYNRKLSAGVKSWTIALAVGEYIEASDPQVLEAVRQAAKVFQTLGAEVHEVELPWLREAAAANGKMTQADAAAFHRERLANHPESFGADVRERLETGRDLSVVEYALARRTQAEVRWRAGQFFQSYQVLLLPTTPAAAMSIEAVGNSASQAPTLTRFTAPFNLSGLPALSLPCGFTKDGLPIGLQIVSAPWQEGTVLRAAHAYETATDWGKRHPSL